MKGYGTCVIDPPWYESGGGRRGAQMHYQLMGFSDIYRTLMQCEPLARMGPQSHCWLWVTDNFLESGLRLMSLLGYRYIRTMVWVKIRKDEKGLSIGLGQYLRGAHELCLMGSKKGGRSVVPAPENRKASVVLAPKGRHSEKPAAAYRTIESVSPGPYLEVFARGAREGWDVWGNEAG